MKMRNEQRDEQRAGLRVLVSRFVLLSCIFLATLGAVRADQLQINSYEDCQRAVEAIRPGSIAVSYCSLCEDQTVDVWRVQRAMVVATGKDTYEVAVWARKLYRSSQKFDPETYSEPTEYRRIYASSPDNLQTVENIDLAYFYTPEASSATRSEGEAGRENRQRATKFRTLGKQLNLPCEVRVETITLPLSLTDAIAEEYDDASG